MASQYVPPLGEVRHSQLLTTYGPGAMVDLPDKSVVIGGLNLWHYDRDVEPPVIHERRLVEKLCGILDLGNLQLRKPPMQQDGPGARSKGGCIRAPEFPNWFVVKTKEPITFKDDRGKPYRTRPLVEGLRLEKRKFRFVDEKTGKRQNLSVVPVRFVQCCPNGHLSDVDWRTFAHEGKPSRCQETLWLDEAGAGNDFTEIYVRCPKCKTRQQLAKTKDEQGRSVLGRCKGKRPWLGQNAEEADCRNDDGKPLFNRLLVRSASNAYFPELISAISIPEATDPIADLIQKNLKAFEKIEDAADLDFWLRKYAPDPIPEKLDGFDPARIFKTLQQVRGDAGTTPTSRQLPLKEEEVIALTGDPSTLKRPASSSFNAEALNLQGKPEWFRQRFDRVLKVHRLREVMALMGFTRLEPVVSGVDGDPLDVGSKRAAIDKQDLSWIPAVENLGEGLFLSIRPEAIEAWLVRPGVKAHISRHRDAFKAWNNQNGLSEETFGWPGAPYVMLHSLAHLLITEAALDCGYGASSIKERIYAFPEHGYGILLYTGGAGSEGTLGGLVALADRIDQLMAQALERGRLCSNDPFCSGHDPHDQLEARFSHGAACHGCLLIAETSCERRNQFLDRSFVLPTLQQSEAAFFDDLS